MKKETLIRLLNSITGDLKKAHQSQRGIRRKIQWVHNTDPERFLEASTELDFQLSHMAQLEMKIQLLTDFIEGNTDINEVEDLLTVELYKSLALN